MELILLSLFVSIAIQIVMFVPAFLLKTDKLTDLSYGLGFIILAIISYNIGTNKTVISVILMFMIILWGIRLAIFLFMRVLVSGKDRRFNGIRENFFKFLGFWFLQGLTTWIIMLPVLSFYKSQKINFNLWIFLVCGFFIWLIGFIIETIADLQKTKFNSENLNKNKFINIGLWKYSRHPNYLGEILCWIGVFLFSVPGFSKFYFLSIISPIWISILLIFITGIPTLEKRYDEKFRNNKEYQEYKRKTSTILLLPRKNNFSKK